MGSSLNVNRFTGKHVHHAIVLNIGSGAYFNNSKIGSKHSSRTYIHIFIDPNAPNNSGIGVHKGRRVNRWGMPFKGKKRTGIGFIVHFREKLEA
jgi:hypothetical protein